MCVCVVWVCVCVQAAGGGAQRPGRRGPPAGPVPVLPARAHVQGVSAGVLQFNGLWLLASIYSWRNINGCAACQTHRGAARAASARFKRGTASAHAQRESQRDVQRHVQRHMQRHVQRHVQRSRLSLTKAGPVARTLGVLSESFPSRAESPARARSLDCGSFRALPVPLLLDRTGDTTPERGHPGRC